MKDPTQRVHTGKECKDILDGKVKAHEPTPVSVSNKPDESENILTIIDNPPIDNSRKQGILNYKHHWFTTTWLIFSTFWALILVSFNVLGYGYVSSSVFLFGALIPLLSIILLWRNERNGFWILLTSCVLGHITYILCYELFGYYLGLAVFNHAYANELFIFDLVGIGILFFAMKIKKNNINLWSRMNNFNIKKVKNKANIVIYLFIISIAIMSFVLLLIKKPSISV
jgi:hypothetical protein